MTYGFWNMLVTMVTTLFIVALIVGLVGFVITFLLTFIPESKCNGDCEQGRRCTCEEKRNEY